MPMRRVGWWNLAPVAEFSPEIALVNWSSFGQTGGFVRLAQRNGIMGLRCAPQVGPGVSGRRGAPVLGCPPGGQPGQFG